MNLIVAVDNNFAIGYQNKLLVSIPGDMKQFKEKTTGKVVILGRKTLETFPKQKPLPNRKNIILSNNKSLSIEGADVVHSIDELLEELDKYNTEDVFVIGGESVYKTLIDYCDTAYVTKIDHEYSADAFFPNLDNMSEWEIVEESEEETYFDISYSYITYKKKKK